MRSKTRVLATLALLATCSRAQSSEEAALAAEEEAAIAEELAFGASGACAIPALMLGGR